MDQACHCTSKASSANAGFALPERPGLDWLKVKCSQTRGIRHRGLHQAERAVAPISAPFAGIL